MTKNITICFRTSDNLRKTLERVSKQERRSVSSMIENILHDYLRNERSALQIPDEKRRYRRKTVGAPALISGLTPNDNGPSAGMVVDLSLGGLQLSVANTFKPEITEDKENAPISVVFTLPESKKPLTVRCVPHHINHAENETNIGASFCDCDFTSYQAIQSCLIN